MTPNQDSSGGDVDRLALRHLEAVTFDVTGTLVTCPRLGEIYAEVLARHTRPGSDLGLDAEVVAQVVRFVWSELECSADPARDRFSFSSHPGHPDGELGFWGRFVERVAEHLGVAPPSRFAVKELFHRFSRAEAWQLADDVVPALSALAERGLRLGVVANWDSRLPALLADLGVGEYFTTVVTSSAVGAEKPDHRIFEVALDALGVPAERALHVGDAVLADVEGAQAVGMAAIHLDRAAGGGLAAIVAEILRQRDERPRPPRPIAVLDATAATSDADAEPGDDLARG